jgi:HlyD family secretion protein
MMSPRWGTQQLLRVLVVLVAASALLALLLPRSAIPVRTARVERSDLRVSVSCNGELRPPPGGELRAPEAGGVADVAVREGSAVRAGQLVLRLSSPELVSAELEARAQLAQLEAEQQAAAVELAQARADLDRRRRTADQDARLLRADAISGEAAAASAAALRTAELRLQAAASRAASLDPAQPSSRLVLARERARQLGERVARLSVHAPIDGSVYALPRVGEAVSLGQEIGGLTNPERPRLLVRIDEPDVPRVSAGQRLVASFDGLPGRRFEGTLRSVDRSLRSYEGRDVAEGEGELSDPGRLLPLNARLSVELVVGERANALLLPRGALLRDGDRRYVLVVRDGRAERRQLEVGLVGLSQVEVLSGLTSGEEVVLPGTTAVAPGQRVRPHAD